MKIQWLIEQLSTVALPDGRDIQLTQGGYYEVPDDSEYFQNALIRGWAIRALEAPVQEAEATPETPQEAKEGDE